MYNLLQNMIWLSNPTNVQLTNAAAEFLKQSVLLTVAEFVLYHTV